ncbi:MAG: IS3 family transposase [Bacteroidales bacterium]|nr:IS3 family transposase [Bacteroidales bacterium]
MFGKTRQAYYKQINHIEKSGLKDQIVLSGVRKIQTRSKTKRWGARKLKDLLNEELKCMGIQVGRDYLFDLLRDNNLLVRSRKRKFFTTDSHHWLRKYDNLLVDKKLTGLNQAWVSDITYVKDKNGDVYYLYLITDAYSQKIVGWHLAQDLKAFSATSALKKAIRSNKGRLDNLIHHSDRGIQYCSDEYTRLLKTNNIKISMTNPGSPQENAIAERVNGILKEEWLYDMDFGSLNSGLRQVREVINIYNTYRPHNSLKNKTPEQIHTMGFKRHETERVIGKTYKYRKRVNQKAHP